MPSCCIQMPSIMGGVEFWNVSAMAFTCGNGSLSDLVSASTIRKRRHECELRVVVGSSGRLNFEAGSRLAMAGTIQFAASLQLAREQLAGAFPALAVPQAKPLSPGALAQRIPLAVGLQSWHFVALSEEHLLEGCPALCSHRVKAASGHHRGTCGTLGTFDPRGGSGGMGC